MLYTVTPYPIEDVIYTHVTPQLTFYGLFHLFIVMIMLFILTIDNDDILLSLISMYLHDAYDPCFAGLCVIIILNL